MSQRILIAFGGVSPEHEVSVITAIQAASALKEAGSYELCPLYISKEGVWYTGQELLDLASFENLSQLKQNAIGCSFVHDDYGRVNLRQTKNPGLFSKPFSFVPDVVLVAFHGAEGENGAFQGLCEQYNVPYTGSGVLPSSLGMHKAQAKRLAASVGVPVVDGFSFDERQWVDERQNILSEIEQLGYPLIVKPLSLGSSIGVQRIADAESLEASIEDAFIYDEHLLVERMIQPLKEVNCSVFGYKGAFSVSVCEQPKGSSEVLSFEDKYLSDESSKGMASADRIIPAPISEDLTQAIQQATTKLAEAMGLSGVARLDFLLQEGTDRFYFNEVNTIPGSFSFYLWKSSGLAFDALLKKLIDDALFRHQKKNGRMRHYETNLLSKRAAGGLKGLKGKN